MTVAIRPNTVGPVVELSALLREIHDDGMVALKARKEKRAKDGIPDAEIDYERAAATCEQAATHLRSGNAAAASVEVKHAVDILTVVPSEPPPFEVPEQAAGIRIRVRYLSEAECVSHRDAIDLARAAARAEGGDMRWSTVAAIHAAQSAFVSRAVAHVDGLSEWDGDSIKPIVWTCVAPGDKLPPEAAAILQSAGVLSELSDAAMREQGLPAKKAIRSGLPAPPT